MSRSHLLASAVTVLALTLAPALPYVDAHGFGAAFAKIVDSLVKHVIMPLVTMFIPTSTGGYQTWSIPLLFGNRMPIGAFLGEIVSFLILAGALFIFMVKILGPFLRKPEGPPPPPTTQGKLLMEIRDLLKAKA